MGHRRYFVSICWFESASLRPGNTLLPYSKGPGAVGGVLDPRINYVGDGRDT